MRDFYLGFHTNPDYGSELSDFQIRVVAKRIRIEIWLMSAVKLGILPATENFRDYEPEDYISYFTSWSDASQYIFRMNRNGMNLSYGWRERINRELRHEYEFRKRGRYAENIQANRD